MLTKWPKAAAKHRASIAETLTTVTPVFVSSSRGAPKPAVLRKALYGWAFRAARDTEGALRLRHQIEVPPPDIAAALAWTAEHTYKVTEVARLDRLRAALDAITRPPDSPSAYGAKITRPKAAPAQSRSADLH
ncbi:hypothetical protein [Streptomyces sp. SID8352]|uniref:hypothetical protein n=1 Tax=Streptomyces sp. SID8352 TaxID=2690338 RepID=UPI001371AD3E|nr:hypothetical protein [Streptomyces sp. SID8352]MYU25645.1 hypothetical protein [Streptomyces sp. SID8352]